MPVLRSLLLPSLCLLLVLLSPSASPAAPEIRRLASTDELLGGALGETLGEAVQALPAPARFDVENMGRELAALAPQARMKRVDELVSGLTMSLATGRDFDAILVAAACVVHQGAATARSLNLLAACLAARGDNDLAIEVLEQALELAPESPLVGLNLARARLDEGRLDEVGPILEDLQRRIPKDPGLWKTVAAYWFAKGRPEKALEAMRRGATIFGGVRKRGTTQRKLAEENEPAEGDSLPTLEAKVKRLAALKPRTTAELVEASFPDEAARLRQAYEDLAPEERLVMPPLPQIDTSNVRGYTRDLPLLGAWAGVVGKRFGAFQVHEKMGLTPADLAGGKAAEAKALRKATRQAYGQIDQADGMMDMLEAFKGFGGVDQDQIDEARRAMAHAREEMERELGPPPSEAERKADAVPFRDEGSSLAVENYGNYLVLAGAYEQLVIRLLDDLESRVVPEQERHLKDVAKEDERHRDAMERIDARFLRLPEDDHAARLALEAERKAEILRHKKQLNAYAIPRFGLWSGLYFPWYAQKLKPALDAYARSAGLYVKTMVHPGVKRREYLRMKEFFLFHGNRACQAALAGGYYAWQGPTDEEEAALREALRAAEEAARAKTPEYEKQLKTPSLDWVGWIEKYLLFEVAVGPMKLKITAGKIEFSAFAGGAGGTISYDMVNNVMETGFGPGGQFNLGVAIGPVDAKLSGTVQGEWRTTRWDFDNGTFKEGWTTVKGEVTASIGPVKGTADLVLDAELHGRIGTKAGVDLPGSFTGPGPTEGGFQLELPGEAWTF